MAVRIERATHRLAELRRARVEAEQRHAAACAALEDLLSDHAADRSAQLSQSLPIRRSRVLSAAGWAALLFALAVYLIRHGVSRL